ncbi:RNHCP domain-containing protein [Candidatus Peribacteria bacterium]|nr:RNHCP domain-containing protein [Candidatus Peribacteria bacterium]
MFIAREEAFVCQHCGITVAPLGGGTYRDHCPFCLHSKHVDRDGPGDRLSLCLGLLEPIAIDQNGKKGFVIEYRCEACGKSHRNKAAPDDHILDFMEKDQQRS